MEKKKILYIITKSNWGGAQRHVFDLVTNLAEDNFEVVVALGGSGELKKRLETEHIKVIKISSLNRDVNILNDFKVFIDLIKIIKKEKPDILHLHSSKIGGLGSLAGRLINTPKIIFTAHGWPFEEDRSFVSQILIKFLSWVTIILSHKTIVVSETEKKLVETLPFVKEKVVVVRNSIDEIQFETKEEARKKLLENHRRNSFWIGTIAELHKNKGLVFAIEAVDFLIKRKNQNAIFVVIGEGEERKMLETIIKEKNLEENIFLIGYRKDAAKLLKAFDIFLSSSIKEGLPYAILEAGMAELPVIATKIGGVPDIIEDNKTGMLVRPKDFKDISLAVSYMISNTENSKLMRKNLKNKIKKEFNLETMMKKIKEIYCVKNKTNLNE